MLVGVFLKSANLPHYRMCLEKFAAGLKRQGVNYFVHDGSNFRECDIAVFFGSWKQRTAAHHVIKNQIVKSVPFIVLETPLLGREIHDKHRYLRIGVNHFLDNVGNFNNKNCGPERWNKISKELGISLHPWRKGGDYILVALQLPGDASLRGMDISSWARDTVFEIRKFTDRPIVIRPHPIIRKYNQKLISEACKAPNVTFIDPGKISLKDHLQSAWASVTYTSGMGIDSVVCGVPGFGMNEGSFIYNLEHDLSTIEQPRLYDRSQWVYNLSYAQWSYDEMAEGLPWLHLKEVFQ